MVDDGVWLEESGVLDLAYTEVGLLPEFTAEVSEEGSLRVLAWYHLAPSFIGGLLEESANVLRHFVLESIEAVVLCAFADNGLQVGLGDFDIHRMTLVMTKRMGLSFNAWAIRIVSARSRLLSI